MRLRMSFRGGAFSLLAVNCIFVGVVCLWLGSTGPAQADGPAPPPSYAIYLPLVISHRPSEHHIGDWIVSSDEMVQDRDVLLDGNLIVQGSGRLILHNMRLTLNGTHNGQYGIAVESGASLTIAAGTIISAARDSGRFTFRVQENARFEMRDSELHGCGWGIPYVSGWDTPPGLEIYAAGAVLENNLFAGNFTGVILTHGADHARITGNRFVGNVWSGISTWQSSAAYIASNTFVDSIAGMWLYEGSNDHIITSNSFVRNPEAGIFAFYAWNNEISNNRFVDAGWAAVDLAKLSGNNRILNNTIERAGNGINIHQSLNNTVQGNAMTGVDQGIELGDSGGNLIANNQIIIARGNYATYGAILLYNSSQNQLLNNTVQIVGQGNAVLLLGDSVRNTLQSNVISASLRGLALHFGADGNMVVSNTISARDEQAIVVDDSAHNVIHHNNFIQSGVPAYDDSGNTWDDGSAGNYWHDYAGAGVYTIGPHGVDHQPLLSPTLVLSASLVAPTIIARPPLAGQSQHITQPTVLFNQAITVAHTLFIEAGGSLTLTNCTVWMSGGTAHGAIRLLAGGSLYVYSSTIRATEDSGNYLFTAEGGSRLVIKDSQVRNVGFSTGMDWGAVHVKSDLVVIENTRFTDSFAGPVILPSAQSNVRVVGNDFSNGYRALFVGNPGSDDQHDVLIANNRITNIIGAAVSINGGHRVTFSDNVLDDVWWGSGVGLSGSDHVVVSNTFSNQWSGASINAGGKGLYIASNVVTGVQGTAISLTGAGHAVLNNTITNASFGITLNDAQSNVLAGNRMVGRSDYGLQIGDGSYTNTVSANTIVSASTGVFMTHDTLGNLLYGNSFVRNTQQGWDFGHNQWDNLGRGNYWSNYTGSDGNGDGIGDASFVVPPNGVDRYPLMSLPAAVTPDP